MTLKFKFIILSFFLIVNSVMAQSHDFKRYAIKSAIVEYELSGMQTGTSTTFFDNYGMQEATYEEAIVDMFGDKQEIKTVSYLNGYWQYNLDLQTNTGTKTKNADLESLVENSDGDLEQLGLEMFKSMGGKLIGQEKLLGKTCDLWELESLGTKVWVWKNIPLQSETEMMGLTILRKAISLKEGVGIPLEKLKVPDGIEFTEVDSNNFNNLMQEIEEE